MWPTQMPSRWWVPLPGVKPEYVKLHHVHAAVSAWFDRNEAEHRSGTKPYALSPLGGEPGDIGLEVATLTDEATRRLVESTREGRQIRLGNQIRELHGARLLHSESWEALAARHDEREWRLEFATPTTFRSGDRSSPLPHPVTILRTLGRTWDAWSPIPRLTSEPPWTSVWVSDLDLQSQVLEIATQARSSDAQIPVTVSGCVGTLTMRCDDPPIAAAAGPLLTLAAYAGVGSMTRKGLGVTRVTSRSTTSPG